MSIDQYRGLRYPYCDRDQHFQQPLSRVCFDSTCENKTLICCICEELQHKKHKTMPLKHFLKKINVEGNKSQSNYCPLYYTNCIDQQRNNYFSHISQYRQQINYQLNDLQNYGKIYFNTIEQTMMSLIQMSNPMNILNEEYHNVKKIRQSMSRLLKIFTVDDIDNFSIALKIQDLVKTCKDKLKSLSGIMTPLMNEFDLNVKKILVSLDQKLTFTSQSSNELIWSNELKGAKVKITGTIAQQSNMQSSGQRFAMLQPSLDQCGFGKKVTWGIKVKKFVGWVGVGICLRNVIKKANYHFNYTNINHGSYLISSNGYSWSHSVKQFNSTFKTFQFKVNDIVYIEYDPVKNKLRFRKSQTNNNFELDIVTPPTGDVYHPCVNLCSTGDSVQIIQPGIALS